MRKSKREKIKNRVLFPHRDNKMKMSASPINWFFGEITPKKQRAHDVKVSKADDLVGHVSRQLGAGGGGAPHLAFGSGRDASKLPDALISVTAWVEGKLKS
jgi:alanyl-tRNA synthetase